MKSWRRSFIDSLALLLLVLSPCARALDSSKASEETVARAREYVRSKVAPEAPGVSAAVGIAGKAVWAEGFGYADLEAKRPVTPATLFRIGSVSKPFTAAALMLLVEKDKLDLDSDIRTYVPSFPDKDKQITVRQLAGHLGGIRHYQGREMYSNQPYPTVLDGLKIFQDDPLLFPPGEKYSYSSYGWNLISAAMETAAEKDFLRYMEESVFKPLGMKNTMPDFTGKDIAARTKFYMKIKDGSFSLAPAVDNSYKWAGGGFLSTPSDMVIFGMKHLQAGFLKQDSLNTLFASQRTAAGKPTGYGIGWFIQADAQGHRVYLHTGGSIGGTSVLLLHPKTSVVVAITANSTDAGIRKENFETLAEIFSPAAQ